MCCSLLFQAPLIVNFCTAHESSKYYIINILTYDQLLWVCWMRRVRFAMHYMTGHSRTLEHMEFRRTSVWVYSR
jgi:hypothetical protein